MIHLTKGEKRKLADIACAGAFTARARIASGAMSVDVACFGLDPDGKLSDERYMVFYNQPEAPQGAVVLQLQPGEAVLSIDPGRLTATIERLVLAASIDGAGSMREIGASTLLLGEASFSFSGSDFDSERAVIIGEVYRHTSGWRFGAVGQGFAGGLAALLSHFGGVEALSACASASPTPAAASAASGPPAKVCLTKPGKAHTISLAKGTAAPAALVVKATWQDNGDGNDSNDDLDLRAGLLLPDGRMHIIWAPKRAGAFDKAPFVHHQGDVRAASSSARGCETILVNPAIAGHHGEGSRWFSACTPRCRTGSCPWRPCARACVWSMATR